MTTRAEDEWQCSECGHWFGRHDMWFDGKCGACNEESTKESMAVVNFSINVSIPKELALKAIINRIDYNFIDPKTKKEIPSECISVDIIETGYGKLFYTMSKVGRSKYSINTHDGAQTHPDGSPFFGIELFSNKKKYEAKLKELAQQGYKECKQPIYWDKKK